MGCQKWLCLCAPIFLTYFGRYRGCGYSMQPRFKQTVWPSDTTTGAALSARFGQLFDSSPHWGIRGWKFSKNFMKPIKLNAPSELLSTQFALNIFHAIFIVLLQQTALTTQKQSHESRILRTWLKRVFWSYHLQKEISGETMGSKSLWMCRY